MILSNKTNIMGFEVELSKIEEEFREIWKNTTGDESDKAVVKASTLNLIITYNDKNQYLKALDLIPEVTSRYPCRIIIILINPDPDTTEIKSHISAFCQPPRQDGKQLCCELITLETGLAGENHLPGILLPLLLPDLPVFLWSPNNLFLNNIHFQNFHKNIERVILYNPDTIDSIDELYKMAGYVIKASKMSKVSDMTWAKLTNWREAIAQFFDLKEGIEYLNNLREIHIEHYSEGISTHAYLLAGWIASRLNWSYLNSPDKYKNHLVFTGPANNKIDLFIKRAHSNNRNSGLAKVEIKSQDKNTDITFVAVKDNDTIKTYIDSQNSEPTFNYITNEQTDDAHLLCYELDFIKEDAVYIEAVKMIWHILDVKKNDKKEIY